jgi:hypothetical protein
MTNTTLEGKNKRVTINLSVDAGENLLAIKFVVAEELGFMPSVTQVVEHLIRKYELNINKGN